MIVQQDCVKHVCLSACATRLFKYVEKLKSGFLKA